MIIKLEEGFEIVTIKTEPGSLKKLADVIYWILKDNGIKADVRYDVDRRDI